MATLYELRSSYEKQLEEEQDIINLRQQYTDLLTSSMTSAQSEYQTSAKTAEQQASYDISGAYANYLKQQRSLMSQGSLESGYKQEVGDILQQQYQTAYGQAKTTQASTTAKAYESYVKKAQEAYSTMSENKELVDKLVQERASRAATFTDLYNQYRGITNADLLESNEYNPSEGKYPVFALNKETGEYELTDYGKDWYAEGLVGKVDTTVGDTTTAMSFEDWLKEQGDEQQIEEWQKYAKDIMKDIAGIEYTINEKGELTLPKYDEEKGKETKLKTDGYIDTIKKPSLDLHWSDYGWVDLGTSATNKIVNTAPDVEDYMKKLGITNEDLKQATGYSSAKDLLTATANMLEKAEDGYSFSEILNSSGFNEAFGKFMATTMLHTWKGFNQGNMQQLAKDTYDQLMTQLADISKKKYTTGA